ncbi:MAG: NAD(P)H-dependent oxidoreductase subunit E [Bacillota bacterium]
MEKTKVNLCIGNCSHLQASNAIITFMHGLSTSTKNKIKISYNSCCNCGKGPKVKVGNQLINKATPEKVLKSFVKKNIPINKQSLQHY